MTRTSHAWNTSSLVVLDSYQITCGTCTNLFDKSLLISRPVMESKQDKMLRHRFREPVLRQNYDLWVNAELMQRFSVSVTNSWEAASIGLMSETWLMIIKEVCLHITQNRFIKTVSINGTCLRRFMCTSVARNLPCCQNLETSSLQKKQGNELKISRQLYTL